MRKNNEESVKFKKILTNDSKNSNLDSNASLNKKRDLIKIKIMDDYGLSETEADNIINKLEIKWKNNQNEILNKSTVNKTDNTVVIDKFESETHNNAMINEESEFSKVSADSSNLNLQDYNHKVNEQSKIHDVDGILSDIIPNYNQHVSIEVKNVSMTFETTKEKIDTLKEMFIKTLRRDKSHKIKIEALKNVSFKIYQGEKVGIIGYNGAGKSTLLNIVCGIYPPNKGEVITNGNISPLLSLGAGFDFNYSGRKNILLNGAVLGYEKEFLLSKMDEIIEFSELGDFIDVPIKNYSSGMLAKLSFSIATVVKPDILIIDEVLSVGDVNFGKKSRDKIKSLMDGQTTVLLVSHSIPQIRELCDKAIWIDNGFLKEFGEVNKVCDHYIKHAEKASNEQLANIQFK